jgi:hypothetical protein
MIIMCDRMTPKEAAVYLGFSTSTLEKWRRGRKEWAPDSKGPRYATMNGRIWYRRDWLDEWQDSVFGLPSQRLTVPQ